MKKISVILGVMLSFLFMARVIHADTPITYKVTGGAHFISDAGTNIDDLVYLSIVGMVKDGEARGQGFYSDPEIGLTANLNFTEVYIVDDHYVCFDGNADVYYYDVYSGNETLRVCATDEPAYDGVADRIGVVIGGTSNHYTHMGYSVDDYAGHIMIH